MSEPIQECSISEATWLRKWVIVNPYNISERMEFDSVHDLAQHLFNSKELILNMVKERDALLAATQWRPIETAPKDGTTFLAYDFFALQRVCHWGFTDAMDGTLLEGFIYIGDIGELSHPTHWMPLPKPPCV